MKQITTKSGIKGYQCHLQDNYSSFDEFDGYGATYGLATRLGFKNALEAWEANPVIQGSTNPEDFCTVTHVNEGQRQPATTMRTVKLSHDDTDLLVNSLFIAASQYKKEFEELCKRFPNEEKETKIYWFDKGNKIYDLANDIKNGNLDV